MQAHVYSPAIAKFWSGMAVEYEACALLHYELAAGGRLICCDVLMGRHFILPAVISF